MEEIEIMDQNDVSEKPKKAHSKKETRHDEERIHVVQKGESLWMIARKELGRGIRYHELMELNKLDTADVTEGQILKLPKRQ